MSWIVPGSKLNQCSFQKRIVTWEHIESPIATWTVLVWIRCSFWVVFKDSPWSAKCNNPKRRIKIKSHPSYNQHTGGVHLCKNAFNHNYHLLFKKELWVQKNLCRMNQFCRSKHDHIMKQRWYFPETKFPYPQSLHLSGFMSGFINPLADAATTFRYHAITEPYMFCPMFRWILRSINLRSLILG